MAFSSPSPLPHPHQDAGHGGHAEPHASSATYFAIFVALLVLTAISFGIGMSMGSLPKWIAQLAMVTVSSAKAMLVILFFMHVLFEANWKYVLTIPAAGMSVFLVGVLYFEFHDRAKYYSEERLIHTAEPTQWTQAAAHDENHAPSSSGGDHHHGGEANHGEDAQGSTVTPATNTSASSAPGQPSEAAATGG